MGVRRDQELLHQPAELRRAGRGSGNLKKLTARLEWIENYNEKEFSLLAAIEKGRKLPDWAEQEPYLEPAENWLLDAYFDLSTGRGIDGCIPWRDMVSYADYAGLDTDVARSFVQIMRNVDSEKLRRHRDRNANSGVEGITPRAENTLNLAEENVRAQTASKETMRAVARQRVAAAAAKGKK